MSSERKIIIGVDFGTTFSGVAWAQTQQPDRRTTINVWPLSDTVREGESSEKVPTKLRYVDGVVQWGFGVPVTAPEDEVIEWFKLRLDPSMSPKFQVGQAARDHHLPTDQLVTDYMSALAAHVRYILREKLGSQVMESLPFEFVVTVPAVWSDLAKDKTLKACESAFRIFGSAFGKVPINLVSEPEAAAIYALHGLDSHGLEVDDNVIVMDAGGGTVDLVSYTITKLAPILEVEEATPGSGGLCGSSFLNQRFADFLNLKLGKLEGFDRDVLAEAVEQFEKKVKRQFTVHVDPNETYMIPVGGVPNNKNLGVNRGRFALKASDVRMIFEPVILECIKLVEEQIAACGKPVKAILLVGGFGASQYLKERVRAAVGDAIQVLQPANAWQAVVQGAIMKGFVNIQGRKARKHYGLSVWVRYDHSKHQALKNKQFLDAYSGFYRVPVMEWITRRGDTVSENQPFVLDFSTSQNAKDGVIQGHSLDILVDGTIRDAPLSEDDKLSVLCSLEADLSHIPEGSMSKRKGKDGQWYYHMHFQIEVIFLSASTRYTLIHDGKRYDTVSAEYV